MDLSSVGVPDRIELSKISNSGKNSSVDGIGDPVSNQELKNLCETITNNPNKKVLQMFQVGPEKTYTIEGQLQFPADSEQDGWQESLDQVIDMIDPYVESLAGAIVEGSVPILELLEYVSQDNFTEVFKSDVSKLTTDTIQTIYNQNPEFFNAISSGSKITQEFAKKFLEDVLRETASTGEIMRENVVEIVQTYVDGFIEKIYDEDFQQQISKNFEDFQRQISNNIDDFSTNLVHQLQTAYGSMSDLATAIYENVDLLGKLVIGEGHDSSWELQPPQNFEVSSDKEGFFQILSDAWNAATRQTIAGKVRLAPGVSDGSEDKKETIAGNVSLASSVSEGSENTTETIAGEVQIKEGVEYLNTLTLNQINAYPTQIKERLDQHESAKDKLQTLASCAENLEDAAKVVRTTWKDQAENADDPYNNFLETALPKLELLINMLPDLDSLREKWVLKIEKELYTLKQDVDKVVEMLNKKDYFGNEKNTDLKPFFESAMQTSLALINGAYGVIRSSGAIDEASQHFDDRQAVLDASDALDPVFDNLKMLLKM
ncbi:MAG: hypothetical protein VXX85_05975, partial [Candidatus Margulisiibacteriota bacterium]|nr:hypothetical protein [Candidatus Margulisiibacteriota bacterium]